MSAKCQKGTSAKLSLAHGDLPLATAQLTSVARNFKCGNVALSAALLGSWSGVVLIARARSMMRAKYPFGAT
jgi:hypothetical protein